MNDDMLIALVQDHEELYDQGSKFYFDGKLKNRRWREIGVKLNKSGKCIEMVVYILQILFIFIIKLSRYLSIKKLLISEVTIHDIITRCT